MCISHINTIFSTAVQSHHNCNHQAKQKCKKKKGKAQKLQYCLKFHMICTRKNKLVRGQTGEEIKIN